MLPRRRPGWPDPWCVAWRERCRSGGFLYLPLAIALALGLAACASKDAGRGAGSAAAEGSDLAALRESVSGQAPEATHEGWELHSVGARRYGKRANGMEFVSRGTRLEEEKLVLEGPATVKLPSGRRIEVPEDSEVSLHGSELFFEDVPVERGSLAIPLGSGSI